MIKYVEPLELDLDVAQGGHENRVNPGWRSVSMYLRESYVPTLIRHTSRGH